MDLDVEDYLDEASESSLIEELNDRGYKIIKGDKAERDQDKYIFPEFKTREDLKKFLFLVMGIRHWQDKDRLISEINELF